MAKVITLSKNFLKTHPKAGQPTGFADAARAVLAEQCPMQAEFIRLTGGYIDNRKRKRHTIRLGRSWRDGQTASLRTWSGKPCVSKQTVLAHDLRLRVQDIRIDVVHMEIDIKVDYPVLSYLPLCNMTEDDPVFMQIVENDALTYREFMDWFWPKDRHLKLFSAQILIWDKELKYEAR